MENKTTEEIENECPRCEGSGEVLRDHAFYQDGATQYETISIPCSLCCPKD